MSHESFQDTLHFIRTAQEGKPRALEALIERHLPRMRQIVALRMGRLLRRMGDVEDLVQDVVVRVLKGLPRFEQRSEGGFRNWLPRCVERQVADQARAWGRKKRGGGNVMRFSDCGSVLASSIFEGREPSPSAVARAKELAERLEDALSGLGRATIARSSSSSSAPSAACPTWRWLASWGSGRRARRAGPSHGRSRSQGRGVPGEDVGPRGGEPSAGARRGPPLDGPVRSGPPHGPRPGAPHRDRGRAARARPPRHGRPPRSAGFLAGRAHAPRPRGHGHQGCLFSPDGNRVFTASWDGLVRVWDAGSGEEVLRLVGPCAAVHWAEWSPDGARLASGCFDPVVRVWDAASGKQLFELEGQKGVIDHVAFSPDGEKIARPGSGGDGLRADPGLPGPVRSLKEQNGDSFLALLQVASLQQGRGQRGSSQQEVPYAEDVIADRGRESRTPRRASRSSRPSSRRPHQLARFVPLR
ncbi:MAG: hypothetical protein HY721_04550 [Planctomycetes bacterium]|nr:hypothetical protein [Planctomycetota bacterium]